LLLQELVVDDYGIHIGKTSERIVLRKNKEVIGEYSILEMEDLIIMSRGVNLSTDVFQLLLENGVQVYLTDYREEPYAMIYSPFLHGTVKTRKEQFASLGDSRGVHVTKQFAYGKIQNQINTLKYYLRSREGEERELLIKEITKMERYINAIVSLTGNNVDEIRPKILNCEGLAAQHYWTGVKVLLGDKASEFTGRVSWNPTDGVNLMLNYGYSIIGSRVLGAIVRSGLEPYAGFIHTDRSGKESLRFDMVEEFRAPIVDRVVISMISRGFKPQKVEMDDGITLHKETRNQLRENLFRRLDTRERYKGKEYLLKTIIQLQARSLASFFREGKPYKAFIARW
jgi:CRISPR-associated protein Cas1